VTPRESPAVEPAERAQVATVAPVRRVIASRALFAGRHEIVIAHGGDEYRLRITKAGKLILTK
jgi:hemin uptake protein HemP